MPNISRRYNGPDTMPAPMPATAGGKGSSLEAEDDNMPGGWAHPKPETSEQVDRVIARLKQQLAKDEAAGKPPGVLKLVRNDLARFVQMRKGMTEAGPQDDETKKKYLKPFYAPDDDDEVGEPVDQAIPDDDLLPGETPDEGMPGEDEVEAGETIWQMDVPEDPEELSKLTAALDAAEAEGVVSGWVEVGAPEEVAGEEQDILATPGEEPVGELGTGMMTPPPSELGDYDRQYGESVEEQYPEEQYPGPVGVDAAGPMMDLDEIPPEMPGEEMPGEEPLEEPVEEEPHYIGVEFAEGTPQEEMDDFPMWISEHTADPETQEGSVPISGWSPSENPEEITELISQKSAEEIPETSPEEFSEIPSEEIPEGPGGDLVPGASPPDETLSMPEARILGEQLKTIYRAYKIAEKRGDKQKQAHFRSVLDHHARDSAYDRRKIHLLLHEGVGLADEVSEVFYVRASDPGEAKAAADSFAKTIEGVEHVDGLPFFRVAGVCREAVEEAAEIAGGEYEINEQVYYDPGEEKIGKHQVKHWTKDIKAPNLFGGPEKKAAIPAELQRMKDDYMSAKTAGDDALAQRIYGELEFMAQSQGVDMKDVLGESVEEKCKTPGRKIRSKGKGSGRGRGKGKGPMGVPSGKGPTR
jgi:hypothetical protein